MLIREVFEKVAIKKSNVMVTYYLNLAKCTESFLGQITGVERSE